MQQDILTFTFEIVLPALLPGIIMTLELAFISLIIGFFIGLSLAIGRVYGPRAAWTQVVGI